MGQRSSDRHSFTPAPDHLEEQKPAGASAFTVGGLAASAIGGLAASVLADVDRPAPSGLAVPAAAQGRASEHGTTMGMPHRPSASDPGAELPMVIVAGRGAFAPASPAPAPSRSSHASSAGGLIHPLNLSPSAISPAPAPAPAARQPLGSPPAVGGGAYAPLVVANPRSRSGIVPPMMAYVGGGGPAPVAGAAAPGKQSGPTAPMGIVFTPDAQVRPVAPTVGYVPTGGSHAMSGVEPSVQFAGSGGTGTGTNTIAGASVTISSVTNSSAAGTTSTPGAWTITGTGGASGGGPSDGATVGGTLSITASGGYIGSFSSAFYNLTGADDAEITQVDWEADGVPLYSTTAKPTPQIVPNPKVLSDPDGTGAPSSPEGNTDFDQVAFQAPPATNKAASISFYYGEQPGAERIYVTVNFTINGVPGEAEARKTVRVQPPNLSANIYYLREASYVNGFLQYASATKSVRFPDGYKADAPVQGIDFTNLRVPAAQGSIEEEQFVQEGTSIKWTTTTGGPTWYGLRYVDPETDDPTEGQLPLLDIKSATTEPWYPPPKADSPKAEVLPNYTLTMNDQFKDYIMFKPWGGIWVPAATFSWSVNATMGPPNWLPAATANATVSKGDHSWPQAWNDLAYKYLQRATR